jgi:hypothetical protein
MTNNKSGEFQTAPGLYYLLDGQHAQPVLNNSTD